MGDGLRNTVCDTIEDIRKAKHYVKVGRDMRREKQRAHRSHRRAWVHYLCTVTKTGKDLPALEIITKSVSAILDIIISIIIPFCNKIPQTLLYAT